MSWLERRNGRQWRAPWEDRGGRHDSAGGAGGADPDSAAGGSAPSGGAPSGGMQGFGGDHSQGDAALLGAGERSITPAGTAFGNDFSDVGALSRADAKSFGLGPTSKMGGVIGGVLGSASPFPGGGVAGRAIGGRIGGGGLVGTSGPGHGTGAGPGRSGAGGGVGAPNPSPGSNARGTPLAPGQAETPPPSEGMAPPNLGLTTSELAQSLALGNAGELAARLDPNRRQDAMTAIKMLDLQLKQFRLAMGSV